MLLSKKQWRTIRNVFGLSLSICLVTTVVWSSAWSRRVFCHNKDRFAAAHEWDLFYHLGGNGPWIPRKSDAGISTALPASCSVNQVHMHARHAARYPTIDAGKRHTVLLKNLNCSTCEPRGGLSFVRRWKYFTELQHFEFENLTSTGPYAGTLQAFAAGTKLRESYSHLVSRDSTTPVRTCSSSRDIETARHFATGFFGEGWNLGRRAQLQIIPEIPERGGDTLTPGKTCRRYLEDPVEGRDLGYKKLAEWQQVFTRNILLRLQKDAGRMELTALDVYSMMEMCGFEILVRGTSPWCELFSRQEWLQFEYARDLLHFYRAGPGNRYAGAMGWLWLNATQELLMSDSATGLYFSFVHDSDMAAMLAALGILDESSAIQTLPTDKIKEGRSWRTRSVIPMGARIVFEKIVCDSSGETLDSDRSYVRLIINDEVFDLRSRVGGDDAEDAPEDSPKGSPSLQQFQAHIAQRGRLFDNFTDICQLSTDVPSRITFLGQ